MRIAVVMDRTEEIQMSLWLHAQRYLRQVPRCAFALFAPGGASLRRLGAWRPEGVLGYIQDRALLRQLKGLGCPVVNASGALPGSEAPTVSPDNAAIGEMAGDYLLGKGYRRFAFVGIPNHHYSAEQLGGLRTRVAAHGCEVHEFSGVVHPLRTIPPSRTAIRRNQPVLRWLTSLATDTGILVVDSWLGMRLCDLAHAEGLRLLDKFALISGHDCDVPSVPSLSGVHLPENRWSVEAARLLVQLITGDGDGNHHLLVKPTGINERESTSRIAVRDEVLRAALRFIHSHADQMITVEDVADAVSLGRRAIERRFKRHLDSTVLHEIHRAHVDRVKRLLVESDLPLHSIARSCGLSDVRQLQRLFMQHEAMTPGAYRRAFRAENTLPNANDPPTETPAATSASPNFDSDNGR